MTVGAGRVYATIASRARSSVVERSAHNRLVAGSNPAEPITVSTGRYIQPFGRCPSTKRRDFIDTAVGYSVAVRGFRWPPVSKVSGLTPSIAPRPYHWGRERQQLWSDIQWWPFGTDRSRHARRRVPINRFLYAVAGALVGAVVGAMLVGLLVPIPGLVEVQGLLLLAAAIGGVVWGYKLGAKKDAEGRADSD